MQFFGLVFDQRGLAFPIPERVRSRRPCRSGDRPRAAAVSPLAISGWATILRPRNRGPRLRMRFALKFLMLLGLVGLWADLIDAAPPTVGDMGSVDRLDLAGARFATADRLKQALGRDLQFLLAAEPSAALDGFLKTIHDRLEAGYRRAG